METRIKGEENLYTKGGKGVGPPKVAGRDMIENEER